MHSNNRKQSPKSRQDSNKRRHNSGPTSSSSTSSPITSEGKPTWYSYLVNNLMTLEPHTVKALIIAIIMLATFILALVGCVATVFYVHKPNGVEVNLWRLCFKKEWQVDPNSCQSIRKFDCVEQHDAFSGARAFVILTVLVAFAAFFFTVLELFDYKTMKWRIMFTVMTTISAIVAMVVCVSFYTQKQCELFGTSLLSNPDSRIGTNPPCLASAWILSLIALSLEYFDEKRWFSCCVNKDAKKSHHHHHHGHGRRSASDKNGQRRSSSRRRNRE